MDLETDIHGVNVDVFVRQPLPGGEIARIAIECKCYNRPIGVHAVEKFASSYKALKDAQAVDLGTMITTRSFSQKAQSLALKYNIHLTTLDDLQHRLTEFRTYIREFNDQQSHCSHVTTDFLPLAGRRLNGEEAPSLDVDLLAWMNGSDSQMLLLGRGGAGKTTLARRLAFQAGQLFLTNNSAIIPLFVDLKLSEVKGSISDIVCALLHRNGVTVTPAQVITFVREGRLCLILDAFDEFELDCLQGRGARNLTDLDLCSSDRSKILISCRTTFFSDRAELLSFKLHTENFQLIPRGRRDLAIEIAPLEDQFVVSHLSEHLVRFAPRDADIPDWLIALCKTPLHLHMVLKAIRSAESFQEIADLQNRHSLYERSITDDIHWDTTRGGVSFSDPTTRRHIYEAIAVTMLNRSTLQISSDLVRDALVTVASADKITASAIRDISNGTLIDTFDAGASWSHKTIGEFLGASYVMRLIRNDDRSFSMIWFTRDERAFIVEMLRDNDIQTLYAWLNGNDYAPTQFAAFILGGCEPTPDVIDALQNIAAESDECLTKINCINTLAYLEQSNVVDSLVTVIASFLKMKNMRFEMPPIRSCIRISVDELVRLRDTYSDAVVGLHVRESVDALSRIASNALVPFLRSLLLLDDEAMVSETKTCIRILEAKGDR